MRRKGRRARPVAERILHRTPPRLPQRPWLLRARLVQWQHAVRLLNLHTCTVRQEGGPGHHGCWQAGVSGSASKDPWCAGLQVASRMRPAAVPLLLCKRASLLPAGGDVCVCVIRRALTDVLGAGDQEGQDGHHGQREPLEERLQRAAREATQTSPR